MKRVLVIWTVANVLCFAYWKALSKAARLRMADREEAQFEYIKRVNERVQKAPDVALMELGESSDRAQALANGKREQFVNDGWDAHIAEQMAATLFIRAVTLQD